MSTIKVDQVLDCKGLACPMPIVKTKKMMEQLEAGQVLEMQATDRGSLADIQGWASRTGHSYLGTTEEGDVLKHYLRKADPEEVKEETKYPHVVQNDELQSKLGSGVTVVDVREPAEYIFGHIPGAVNIPLGDLEQKVSELNKEDEIYVICRTGNRSDMACQTLAEQGFSNVKNVVPGMSQWQGDLEEQA
jgi:rhodanese-related sulfurtransferase/TusA-related sulfurtransferase